MGEGGCWCIGRSWSYDLLVWSHLSIGIQIRIYCVVFLSLSIWECRFLSVVGSLRCSIAPFLPGHALFRNRVGIREWQRRDKILLACRDDSFSSCCPEESISHKIVLYKIDKGINPTVLSIDEKSFPAISLHAR